MAVHLQKNAIQIPSRLLVYKNFGIFGPYGLLCQNRASGNKKWTFH